MTILKIINDNMKLYKIIKIFLSASLYFECQQFIASQHNI